MKKSLMILALMASVLGFAESVFALPPDFSALTAAVDFSTVITAIMGIFAALAGVYIVIRGGTLILGRVRGR